MCVTPHAWGAHGGSRGGGGEGGRMGGVGGGLGGGGEGGGGAGGGFKHSVLVQTYRWSWLHPVPPPCPLSSSSCVHMR